MGVMLRAVVVGINEYKDERYREKARLRFASGDAKAIAGLLRSPQTAQAFTVESLRLLTDAEATRKAVRESLNSTFSSRSFDSNTIALFYFAGHGVVNPHDQRISLCCHDVDFTDPEAGGIRLNDVYDWLASSSAECVIAIIDACFSGGMITGLVDHLSAAQRAMQAIEALRYPEGKTIAIFAACASDEAARERLKLGHGIFTYELLRGWRDGAAQEKDGVVSLLGLANFLTRDLTKYTQKPQITIRGSRPITLWHVESSLVSPSPSLPPPPPAPSIMPTQQASMAGMVYQPVTLPTAERPSITPLQERNRLIIIFAILVLAALLLCSFIALFIIHISGH
jgi:uncharacterized caspase-like protein